ncbi:putative membrane protein DUF2339 [Aquimarina sp. MAR_2010_214]|uniref:DUF2339 domain-containing protein n=1 Tax=Aquimarina sp. MAR_2010_214 TaxID=1250026 RepID=UPI000C707CFC|nr:DUF2339 domain-containing protein [Aquimarina sp. MAR_2010_214]PKV50027.1 putative membrane protein DUF2339 [Aquimarina sp. MAR_2010_214]
MGNNEDQIHQLLEKLEILLKRQQDFSTQIQDLKDEIHKLKISSENQPSIKTEKPISVSPTNEIIEKPSSSIKPENVPPVLIKEEKPVIAKTNTPKKKSNLEKFIGENLINKIGIIIIIIGVAIGAKYTIEHDLIGPLTRIILGYLTGLGLLGIGMKLKKKYENFSAVLVSGAMTILYFITFLAYDLYGLIPQNLTFILMLLFTAFTVFAAIQYNKQIIAHVGLVGAYAVPFLLSDGSGRVVILFSYMAIINIGILIIAIKKYWKPLYFSSFLFTWIIFMSWYAGKYSIEEHFALGFVFLTTFFITFYLMFLVYKLRKKESFKTIDVILQLSNSFVFYGIGFSMLNNHEYGKELLGVFTLINAVIHFVVSVIVHRLKLADRNLFYFVSGMVLIFITIAFPVQLDGNWVTLLWAGEAALLFWIGRTKKVPIYEILSYPLWALTFFSLLHDWIVVYYRYSPTLPETKLMPVFNIYLMTSIICIVSFAFIYITHRKEKLSFPWPKQSWLYTMLTIGLVLLLVCTSYFTFWIEIDSYWNQVYQDIDHQYISQNISSTEQYTVLSDTRNFKAIWLINYSLLFLVVLSFVNIKKIKNNALGYITLGFILFALFGFLTRGLFLLSELRVHYLELKETEFSAEAFSHIGIRYLSFVFVGGLLFTFYKYVRQQFLGRTFKIAFEIILHCTLIWIVSSELIHWLDLSGYTETYKLGLSILWGVYALLLIVLGIWKRKKHLRVLAIIVFGITLIKLFFYDISHMETIAKTIVFLALGVLLLIISFLYNKYKHIIADEHSN